jgi:chromate transporter
VVGVIANLAVFFAWHVLWPQGWAGPFDWPSALLGLAARSRAAALEGRRDPRGGGRRAAAGLAITLARQGG